MRACLLFAGLLPIAFAQTPQCPVTDLQAGSSASGTLEAADCKYNEFIRTSTNAGPVKQYRITVAPRAIYTLDLTSADFDTVIYLLRQDRAQLVALNDDAAGQGTNSRLIINLPPGTYYVFVAGKRPEMIGQFELKSAVENPRACLPTDLTVGTDLQGSFLATGCRGMDAAGNTISTDTTLISTHRIQVARRGSLALDVDSTLPLVMRLTPQVGTAFSFASRTRQLIASQTPGGILLTLTSATAGAYTVKSKLEDLRPCTPQTLDPAASVTAGLAAADCRILDYFVPSSDDSLLDIYRMEVTKESVVTIDMTSLDVDALIAVLDSRGRQVAFNDDASDDNTDAQVNVHLPPGVYTILAAEFETKLGSYIIKTASETPRQCEDTEVKADDVATGPLKAEGCRIIDAVVFETDLRTATPLRINLPSKQVLRVDSSVAGASSGGLHLLDSTGRRIIRTSLARGIAELEIQLNPGVYRLLLAATADATATYQLRPVLRNPRTCPVDELGPTGSADGSLVRQDCGLVDLATEWAVPTPARAYSFTLAQPGRLTAELTTAQFEPVMLILDDKDEPVALSFSFIPTTLRQAGNLPAGTYRLIATTLLSLGNFTVRTTFESSAATATADRDIGSEFSAPVRGLPGATVKNESPAVEFESAKSRKKLARLPPPEN